MADTSIKVHACCRFSAPLANAGVELFKRGVDYRQVESILARVNKYSIKVLTIPEEIELVILTHLHWDHAGNNGLFKNARFYVQKREAEYGAAPLKIQQSAYNQDLIFRMHYELSEGEAQIAEGIRVIPTPGHSPGSQSVIVDTETEPYMIVGDLICLYDCINRDPMIINGLHTNLFEYYDSLERAVGTGRRILPGHEPKILEHSVYPYHKVLEYMDSYLSEATEGDLRIEIYPNAQLGDERALQEGTSMRTVDIGIGATATLSNFTDDFALFDLPYLFSNKAVARRTLHSQWAGRKLGELESLDMAGLIFWEAGMFDIINSERSVNEISDFSGLSIRVMENDIFMSTMTALGINPVPMAWPEVFTSIQNGTVDGTSNSPATIYTASIHTIANHFTVVNMIYSPIPVVMSKFTYDSLPEEYQELIVEAAVEVVYFTEEQIARCQALMKEKFYPEHDRRRRPAALCIRPSCGGRLVRGAPFLLIKKFQKCL